MDQDGDLRNPHVSDELHSQMKWCTRYYKTHLDDIPNGEYIAVMYPMEEAARYIRNVPNGGLSKDGLFSHPWKVRRESANSLY